MAAVGVAPARLAPVAARANTRPILWLTILQPVLKSFLPTFAPPAPPAKRSCVPPSSPNAIRAALEAAARGSSAWTPALPAPARTGREAPSQIAVVPLPAIKTGRHTILMIPTQILTQKNQFTNFNHLIGTPVHHADR